MIRWTLALALGAAVAWLAYGRGGTASRTWLVPLALLRAAAVALVAALLFGAPSAPPRPAAPLVALDASASWRRAAGDDSTAVRAIRDFVRTSRDSAVESEDVVLVGDSLRDVSSDDLARFTPADASSRVRPAVDRAAALGRPLLLVTDGEVEDADALGEAPPGSSIRMPTRSPRRDVGLAELTLPSTATAGDTLQVAALIVAGAAGAPDGTLALTVDGVAAGSAPLAALAANASTRVSLPLVMPRGARTALVRAVLRAAGDAEPRNDTLAAPLEIGDRPPAVFVTTAPDLDVREALVVLRGALSLPTRAYLRIAPGVWREEGTLAPVSEADVRARATSAGLLVLHGDTTFAPRSGVRGARALWVPAAPTAVARPGETVRATEWYVSSAPPSPLSASLAGLPWDTLPPVTLASAAAGQFTVLNARLGKSGAPAAAIAGRVDAGARTIIVSGSGYAGWALRGGRSAEAFTALWGAIFDWLAAARGDLRAARPIPAAIREGDPVRWRRGGSDSLVLAVVTRRAMPAGTAGAATPTSPDTLRLHFAASGGEFVTAALPSGVYDVRTTGGASVLVVNASREWVPRAPSVTAGPLSRGALATDAPRLTDATWPFVVVLLLLCAEWIGRRSAGLR